MHLQNLTCVTTGSDHTISKSATADKITVTGAEFTALSGMAVPGSITINGTDTGTGTFTVSSVTIP